MEVLSTGVTHSSPFYHHSTTMLRSLKNKAETTFGVDMDGDGKVGSTDESPALKEVAELRLENMLLIAELQRVPALLQLLSPMSLPLTFSPSCWLGPSYPQSKAFACPSWGSSERPTKIPSGKLSPQQLVRGVVKGSNHMYAPHRGYADAPPLRSAAAHVCPVLVT